MSDLQTVIAERGALVAEYGAIVTQLENIEDSYARLDAIKVELAEMEETTIAVMKEAGLPTGPFPSLPTPPDVRLHVPQVKASEARTARLRWILDNQGEEGVSVFVPEEAGEDAQSAFAAVIAETGRTGNGDDYNVLSDYVRRGFCKDNGERGVEKRRFFVDTSNAHVIEWLGL